MFAALSALLGCALLVPVLGEVTVTATTTFTYEAPAGHTVYTPIGTTTLAAATTTLHIPLTTTTTFDQALFELPGTTFAYPPPPPATTTVTVVDNVYTKTSCPKCTETLPAYVTVRTPGTATVTQYAATSTVLKTTATYTTFA